MQVIKSAVLLWDAHIEPDTGVSVKMVVRESKFWSRNMKNRFLLILMTIGAPASAQELVFDPPETLAQGTQYKVKSFSEHKNHR